MRASVITMGFVAAFAAGVFTARVMPDAHAQGSSPVLSPQIINLAAMTDDQIGPLIPNTDLRSKTLAVTEYGTVAIQSGNVFKHYHADANEFQYIIEGAGSFWLDKEEHQIKAGDLIVIPKGTVHAGSKASTGRFKAIAIKMPPQRADDTNRVD